MRKVLIIGCGGAGKSTFAQRLGRALELEVIHLDRFYWKSGWIEPSKEEWLATVEQLLGREAWVMDGNYSGTLERRLKSADTVVFLDLPIATCLWRVLKRVVTHYGQTRPDMADGCPEQLSLEFLVWIWNYSTRSRPKVLQLLSEHRHGVTVTTLRSTKEVEGFLAQVRSHPRP